MEEKIKEREEILKDLDKQESSTSESNPEESKTTILSPREMQKKDEATPCSWKSILSEEKMLEHIIDYQIFAKENDLEETGVPIPFRYQELFPFVVDMDNPVYKGEGQRVKYLGARYTHSGEINTAYGLPGGIKMEGTQGKTFQSSLLVPQSKSFCNLKLSEALKDPKDENPITFDSSFETGNLDLALEYIGKDGLVEYDLFIRPDANYKTACSWFHYVIKTHTTNLPFRARFNIRNYPTKKPLFNIGMKVVIKSVKANEEAKKNGNKLGQHWGGENFRYGPSVKLNEYMSSLGFKKKYSTLSFEYEFAYPSDIIHFSLGFPYSYSKLLKTISKLNHKLNSQLTKENEKSILSEDTLCHTLSGIPVPLLTITDPSVDLKTKKFVLISARVHPGEFQASWMMNGLLNFLCGESAEAKILRSKLIFKVVPMLNPDGVIAGNTRSSYTGCDLNRQYYQTSQQLFPTIYELKSLTKKVLGEENGINMISEEKENIYYKWTDKTISKPIIAFFDLHGHSKQTDIFAYGHMFENTDDRYYQSRIIPKLLSNKTGMFKVFKCKFHYGKAYEHKTARNCMGGYFGITCSYTIEASAFAYRMGSTVQPLSVYAYARMGEIIGMSILDYIYLYEEKKDTVTARELFFSKDLTTTLGSPELSTQAQTEQSITQIKPKKGKKGKKLIKKGINSGSNITTNEMKIEGEKESLTERKVESSGNRVLPEVERDQSGGHIEVSRKNICVSLIVLLIVAVIMFFAGFGAGVLFSTRSN